MKTLNLHNTSFNKFCAKGGGLKLREAKAKPYKKQKLNLVGNKDLQIFF
jgi:hypothetical protein